MKFKLILLSQLFIVSLFAQTFKYDLVTSEYRLNYFSHKGDVKCKECKYYSFTAKYPDGTDVPLCRMVNNCIFSQMLFVKKYMDQDDKLAQYRVEFQFKSLTYSNKLEAKTETASTTRRYYYRIPIQSVLNIKVTTTSNEVILDSTITTNSSLQFPSAETPTYLPTEVELKDFFRKNEKSLDYATLRKNVWPDLEKQAKRLLSPVFEDEESEIEIKFFTVKTKDPEFQALTDMIKKMDVLVAEINKANSGNNHLNWHSEQIAKKVDEYLPVVTAYLDPKFSARFTDAKDKLYFTRMMRYNAFLLQLLSSDFDAASKSLAELNAIKLKEGNNFGPKKLEEVIEKLEPVFQHEKATYQAHKTVFNYFR